MNLLFTVSSDDFHPSCDGAEEAEISYVKEDDVRQVHAGWIPGGEMENKYLEGMSGMWSAPSCPHCAVRIVISRYLHSIIC